VIALVPELEGADQPIVTLLSDGLIPVIVGALGESPKVKAFANVADPAEVVTVTSTTPPAAEAGLTNVRDVPSVLSVQLVTELEPTLRAVTPTRNDPLSVIGAPPVFGTSDLLVWVIDADCLKDSSQASVTESLVEES
jgi:hypothetical protein